MAEKQVYLQQDNMQSAAPPPPPYQQKYETTVYNNNQHNHPTNVNTIALFPQYTSPTPQSLKMRGEIMSSTWTVTSSTSTSATPILTLESEGLFTSKMSFLDPRTNSKLFTLQRTKFSFKDHYYAPSPSGREGETLLEITKETKVLGKGKLVLTFQNPVDGRVVRLELQSHSFSSDCEVFCGGRVVARVTAKMMSMHGEYGVVVEDGVDAVLVVVLVYVVADLERRRSSASAGASAGAGGGC